MDVREYAPGQQLPGTVYRVVRHLATGGMGSVYDVEDITVGKRYVLKTLHPQLVNRKDLAKRMEAEARALAKLQHPNIVDVFTAGVTSDAQKMPFYVMERLNGQNLRVVIDKKGALEMTHAYRIATDVLDALEQAHENQIVHRDVKPENIFLHRNVNGTTITKLLDFGIMRIVDKKASHTQGKFIGTLRYASPEQIFGGELGPSSDIYSLGVVLYEMLAGRGPFDELSDAYAIGAAHAQRPPPPLSSFVRVPYAAERLVMSALGKTPAERPRDCFTFASELRRLLREEEERPPSSATEVGLVSAPPVTHPRDVFGATASSPSPQIIAATPVSPNVRAATPAPDFIGAGQPSTIRETPSYAVPSAPAEKPAHLGLAATVASEPGPAPPASDARPARVSGAPPPERPAIDRFAETRMSAQQGGATQRLAPNGTAVEDLPAAPPEIIVRHDLDVRMPSGAPPAYVSGPPGPMLQAPMMQAPVLQAPSEQRPPPSSPTGSPQGHRARSDTGGDLVFPARRELASGTGPLAGEAATRPPERSGMLGPLLGAGFAGALIVGLAIVIVMRPDILHGGSAPANAPGVLNNTTAVTATPPAIAAPAANQADASAPVAAPVAAPTPSPITPPNGAVVTSPPPSRAAAGGGRGRPAPARVDPAPVAAPPAPAPAPAPKPSHSGPVRPEDIKFD